MATRVTCVFAACAGALFAQGPATEQKPSVEGIAVDASTGELLRKAYVKIWQDGMPGTLMVQAVSGADGRFRMNVIAAGEYLVDAERPGYLDCNRCMTVRVATGQAVTGV